jgi:YegS/Rv2252/BmrU family lipid kinase
MKKFILYYNPVSGNATFKHKLDDIIKSFQQRDCMLLPYRTLAGDNRPAFSRFARAVDADGIIAAGGDGTLSQVVNIIIKEGLALPIAVIGSGTSNDFAMSMGCGQDMAAYFDRIAAGRTRRMDIGRAGSEYFINVASAGMLTSIAHDVDHRWKNVFGKLAYYIKGLGEIHKIRSFGLQVEADGTAEDMEAFLFVIANNSVVAGLKDVAPRAKVDDGKLDMLVLRKCNPLEFMHTAKDILAGRLQPPCHNVAYIQAAKFHITADTTLESDIDGEAGPMMPLDVETIPGAVEIYY